MFITVCTTYHYDYDHYNYNDDNTDHLIIIIVHEQIKVTLSQELLQGHYT